MRHDEHFVEALVSPRGKTVGHMVDIDRLVPNPHQPRKRFDGVDELVHSIMEQGVLAPIIVRAMEDGRFQVVAGERRFRACQEAGLSQIPCIEMEVDDRGVLELSLVENIQRRDLSAFEEADAISELSEKHGYTHEVIARKLGKSRSTVTEMLTIASIPDPIRDECRHADIDAKSMLLEIAKCPDAATMLALVRSIRDEGLQRVDARRIKKEHKQAPDATRPFIFKFQPEDRQYRIALQFRKHEVDRTEVIAALKDLVRRLEEDGETEEGSRAAQ
jgi:ParB family chromosome partitioning protein